MSIIETHALTKSYGPIQAVRAIDLSIEKGEIFGLLGQNGSGKSSIIKSVLGLIGSSGEDPAASM